MLTTPNHPLSQYYAIGGVISACAVSFSSIFVLNFIIYPFLAPSTEIGGAQFAILASIGIFIAFVLYFAPLGPSTESWDKKTLILGGLIFQLLFGCLQSISWNFWSFLCVRFGLAIGCTMTILPSIGIIAQLDPIPDFGAGPAYSIFSLSIYLGLGLASFSSSLLYIYGWEMTFGLYSLLCGLEVLVVIMFIPNDRGVQKLSASTDLSLITMWFTRLTPGLLLAAGALRFLALLTTAAFIPIFFQRFAVDSIPPVISRWVGLCFVLAGCIAAIAAAPASSLLISATSRDGAPALLAAVGAWLALIFLLVLLFVPLPYWAMLMLFASAILVGEVWVGPSCFLAQGMGPDGHPRGTAASATAFLVLSAALGSTLLPFVGLAMDLGLSLQTTLAGALGLSLAGAGGAFLAVGLVARTDDYQALPPDASGSGPPERLLPESTPPAAFQRRHPPASAGAGDKETMLV